VPKLEANRMLGEAFAGIDEAVLKAVQANHLALQQLAAQRESLRESHFQRALEELERLEDDLYARVKEAAKRGGSTSQVAARLEEFSDRVHDVVKQQRRTALKAAEAMAGNFTALASGILIGLTEGLQQGKQPPE
jgi:ABC-type transporter Mla subunit MlaD